jgi:hypothetical protein
LCDIWNAVSAGRSKEELLALVEDGFDAIEKDRKMGAAAGTQQTHGTVH